MEKLIHKSSGELIPEDPFKIPGTIVEFTRSDNTIQRGILTEETINKRHPLTKPGNTYEKTVYAKWDDDGTISWMYLNRLRVVGHENS